jgi:NnrS protein
MPVFMRLRPLRNSFLLLALVFNTLGVILGFLEHFFAAGIFLLVGASTVIAAIRFFEPAVKPAKTVNVHRSFPVFIRIAYGWLLIAPALSIWAALTGAAPGIWGASRHALTVGFMAAMIFCVGQRILPSFCGMRVLWSPRLMLVMLVLLMTGCTLRVTSEILAYQDYAKWAWNVLPISALIELAAVALFAVNLIVTFARPPAVVTSPLTMITE